MPLPEWSDIMEERRRKSFVSGFAGGLPIGLGYFAVAFSLGIRAKAIGMTPFQGFLVSLLCNASAGEYAGFTAIAAHAGLLEIALVTLVANARYLLMSAALSQKFDPRTPFIHRPLIAFDVTDEIFALGIAREGYLDPWYMYGVFVLPLLGWSSGTALGIVMGSILPARLVSALGVALYGMFIASIVPPAKKDRVVLALVAISFALSGIFAILPGTKEMSDSLRVILLTLILAGAAALLFPREEEDGYEA
ncbi:MAG: AzlC family ABC transporter permease [Clostridiales bacterium]|nr:AzlC family ABC transporter permease [Clostridiales bacterium]